jgi:hypothetical protein
MALHRSWWQDRTLAPSSRALLQRRLSVDPGVRYDTAPHGVGPELPGQQVVLAEHVEDLVETLGEPRIADRRERLDPTVEVPWHQVAGADQPVDPARLAAEVTGQDARARNRLARLLPHAPGGLVAHTVLSAFEQALWDVAAQAETHPTVIPIAPKHGMRMLVS